MTKHPPSCATARQANEELMLMLVIVIMSEIRDGDQGRKAETKEPCLLCAQADPQ
jgi:hypothetical protein